MGVNVFLKDVRVTFPKFFPGQEEPFEGKGDPYWSGSFLFDSTHPQYMEVQAAIVEAAKQKFGDKADAMLKVFKAKDKLPWHDGELKADKPYGAAYAGKKYISARNKATTSPPIPVFDITLDPATKKARVITSPNDPRAPYSGCYVNVKLNIFGYDAGGGQGVGASIAGVQFARDGERLSGASVASADEFEAIPEVKEAQSAADLF